LFYPTLVLSFARHIRGRVHRSDPLATTAALSPPDARWGGGVAAGSHRCLVSPDSLAATHKPRHGRPQPGDAGSAWRSDLGDALGMRRYHGALLQRGGTLDNHPAAGGDPLPAFAVGRGTDESRGPVATDFRTGGRGAQSRRQSLACR